MFLINGGKSLKHPPKGYAFMMHRISPKMKYNILFDELCFKFILVILVVIPISHVKTVLCGIQCFNTCMYQ
ncbi:unnamed protein product [Rhizophagus irregularis]|uniref:Uncharacterized protein n=1 Tax=Rhizophagus irregularis TaxID=588596 RepID=A0A915YY22_9GLOM|nr:unnamed protein product [Rhizophagus irregularis]